LQGSGVVLEIWKKAVLGLERLGADNSVVFQGNGKWQND